MLLNPTEKTVLYCQYRDVEKAIEEYFGKPYELPCIEEKGNDEDWEVNIDGKVEKYDQEDIDAAYAGKYKNFGTRTLLNHLASKDLIPKGNYLIDVSW